MFLYSMPPILSDHILPSTNHFNSNLNPLDSYKTYSNKILSKQKRNPIRGLSFPPRVIWDYDLKKKTPRISLKPSEKSFYIKR